MSEINWIIIGSINGIILLSYIFWGVQVFKEEMKFLQEIKNVKNIKT